MTWVCKQTGRVADVHDKMNLAAVDSRTPSNCLHSRHHLVSTLLTLDAQAGRAQMHVMHCMHTELRDHLRSVHLGFLNSAISSCTYIYSVCPAACLHVRTMS